MLGLLVRLKRPLDAFAADFFIMPIPFSSGAEGDGSVQGGTPLFIDACGLHTTRFIDSLFKLPAPTPVRYYPVKETHLSQKLGQLAQNAENGIPTGVSF